MSRDPAAWLLVTLTLLAIAGIGELVAKLITT